jgi:hypothetical protein
MDRHDDSGLAGMTANERLFHAGILDQWDAAVQQRDRKEMIVLLEQVEVSDPHFTVDSILAKPNSCSS